MQVKLVYKSWRIATYHLILVCSFVSIGVSKCNAQAPEDQGQGPALLPEESAQRFVHSDQLDWQLLLSEPDIEQPLMATFDSKGRMWVVEYRQYPEPEGLKPLSRDNFWRIVYDSVPLPPGKGGLKGKDRISIHEDQDGDGKFDRHSIFVEGLNIATSVVPTESGAWVLNPPYLLFYPDNDGDSKADGDPEIHLEGFGLEDTHSVVNSLTMGPDGWLYGAQGSTVTGAVKRFGSVDPPIKSMGQAIWRYHPKTHRYEIFAEGGGNAFGVAFNDNGEIFSGHNGGDTRGFHYYQGGYYRKGFNKHGGLSNPHAYGYLNPMAHPPVQRFTHTMLLVDGTAFQDQLGRSMIAVDPLHGKLIQTELISEGSTYKTKDVADLLSSEDKWFRPVAITDGPDGSAFVCDWYDFQVAHLYAHQGKMDREHGRIYRLSPSQRGERNDKISLQSESLHDTKFNWNAGLANGKGTSSLAYLFEKLDHPYRWQRWMASRLIASHPDASMMKDKILRRVSDSTHPLDYLWTAARCGWISDTIGCDSSTSVSPVEFLRHPNPYVRAWTIRMVCDDGMVSNEIALEFLAMEAHPAVSCQLVASARRLPGEFAVPILFQTFGGLESDSFFPNLQWWALEKHSNEYLAILYELGVDITPEGEEAFRSNSEKNLNRSDSFKSFNRMRNQQPRPLIGAGDRNLIEHHPTIMLNQRLVGNLIRRWNSEPSNQSLTACVKLLSAISRLPIEQRASLVKVVQDSFEKAYEGKSLKGVPDEVIDMLVKLGNPSLSLLLRRGDQTAIEKAALQLKDSKLPLQERMQIAKVVSELADKQSLEPIRIVLMGIASNDAEKPPIREACIAALAGFNDPEVAHLMISSWPKMPEAIRPVCSALFASRIAWTRIWIDACDANQVDSDQLSLESVRAMRNHSDQKIQLDLNRLYPETAALDLSSVQKRCEEIQSFVLKGNGDPYRGKKLYRSLCARCHKLFDDGGDIGPDLTGYQRDQLQTLLRNIVGPSLEIREGYRTVQVQTTDDRVLSGFVESRKGSNANIVEVTTNDLTKLTNDSSKSSPAEQLVLRTIDGLSHVIESSEISEMKEQLQSLMPEGLLEKLSEQDIVDLVSYLRSSQPLSDG